jgi:hypothetical protein
MLLYSSDHGEDKAVAKYVNEALKRGHLTVYIPINASNKRSHISDLASEIIHYEENVSRGNLLTFDIRSFYNQALSENLQPLEELKIVLEEAIKERIAYGKKDDEIILVVCIADKLIRNEKFDQSISIEKWWQKIHSEWLQKDLKVTLICPHPSPILDKSQFMDYKQAMSSLHDITLDPIPR